MGQETHTRTQTSGVPSRPKPAKWYYVYFLLAAFDLVTVSAGLWLNYRIMGIYLKSVEVNRVWADRVSAYSHLGELAGDVDAPGNDVFDTHDVAKESARMEVAVANFDKAIQQRVVTMLERHLKPGGYLFIAHSESLNGIVHGLEPLQPAVFRKRT